MAELCRECFIKTWHPSQYDIDHIVMSKDSTMCEGCMSWGPYVDYIGSDSGDQTYFDVPFPVGCKECNAKYDKHDDWRCGGRNTLRVYKNTLYTYDSRHGWTGVHIKFCPFCGRELSKILDTK